VYDAAFVSSPGGGRGRFAAARLFLYGAYTRRPRSVSISYAAIRIFHPAAPGRNANSRRAAMSILFSSVDTTRAPRDEQAYRAWLISRQQSAIVYHSGAIHLKRLRVLARKIGSHVGAAFSTIHEAILAAKMRRVQRELIFHTSELKDFPQTPLILGDKWNS
jgi:hypothetical protein